jgi:putative membrane protein
MIENIKPVPTYGRWVILLTLVINGLVTYLFFAEGYQGKVSFDLRILPKINAILNSFTTVFLLAALFAIIKKQVKLHFYFIIAAFITTALFLVTYLVYHFLAESTRYGGAGIMAKIYYFILISHILLAIVIVPLALVTFFRGIHNQVEKHRTIARWTMPLWLYVSITGVLVYLMISPYYK